MPLPRRIPNLHCRWLQFCFAGLLAGLGGLPLGAQQSWVQLDATSQPAGYLACLLINEVPFPGERGYVSEENTQAAMQQVLWVLHCRLRYIPNGYRQEHVAGVRSNNFLDLIVGTPQRRQCEGFYREADGHCAMVPRVQERIRYLCGIANRGQQAGRFARLLNHAQSLARSYVAQTAIATSDRYAQITILQQIPVTGRAYSWMTDRDYYHPGGNFVTIPDTHEGMLGGNRFFTLRKQPK